MDWLKTAWLVAGALALLMALAEWLHARRVHRAAALAFGPGAGPLAWTRAAPGLRILSLAAVAWSLVVLLGTDGRLHGTGARKAMPRDLVILLDVSPSMNLRDAGPDGRSTRAGQAAAIARSILDRIPPEQARITMVACYSEALPLVSRCGDREVIWNFMNRMPLVYAFPHGKTDLLKGVNKAGAMAAEFPRRNATLLVLSDGDTVADTGLQSLPSAFAGALIVGVGNRLAGTFIDGHVSRQDDATLAQLARRLSGVYHDGNAKQVPTALLKSLESAPPSASPLSWSPRLWALVLLAAGGAVLAGLPALLQRFGSGWRMTMGVSR